MSSRKSKKRKVKRPVKTAAVRLKNRAKKRRKKATKKRGPTKREILAQSANQAYRRLLYKRDQEIRELKRQLSLTDKQRRLEEEAEELFGSGDEKVEGVTERIEAWLQKRRTLQNKEIVLREALREMSFMDLERSAGKLAELFNMQRREIYTLWHSPDYPIGEVILESAA